MKKDFIIELNWVRALAAISIVLYHYTARYNDAIGHIEDYPFMCTWGCGAVNTFFLLTGFLTICNLQQEETVKRFVYKRCIRLYPSYWACIFITSIVTCLFMPNLSRSISSILVNLTMLQTFVGIPNVDGVYWTLAFEIIFYVCISAIILLNKKISMYRNIIAISLIWMLASVINLMQTNIFGGGIKLLGTLTEFCPPFVCGMMLSLIKQNINKLFPWILAVISGVLSYLTQSLDYFVYMLITASVVLFVVIARMNNKQYMERINKISKLLSILNWFAGISYPLFLIHQFVGWSCIYHLEQNGFVSELYLIIPITVSIILAHIVTRYVDIPLTKYLKQYVK